MSEPGDVVWADGRTWMRTDWRERSRWITESNALPGNRTALRSLKAHDDFRWLVRNGEPWANRWGTNFRELLAAADSLVDQRTVERDRMRDQRDKWEARAEVGVDEGRSRERAAIVAWLRGLRVSAGENITTDVSNRMDDFATWIERGDHLTGDDE